MTADPVAAKERSLALDVLRGAAILGILVVNIQSFSMIEAAYYSPSAHGDLSGANLWVWRMTKLLFDLKFLAIFSMLFGASIVMMGRKAEATVFYRRILVLLLIGLVHAYLIWYGDILVVYAMLGFVLYFFRNLRTKGLFALGMSLIAIGSALGLLVGWSVQFWSEADLATFQADLLPSEDAVSKEVEAYRGGWLEQMPYRAATAFGFQTLVFVFWSIWRLGGLMLVGMALFKLGVVTGEHDKRRYRLFVILALLVGVPIVVYGILRQETSTEPALSLFLDSQLNYWGSLVVALGWIGLFMLIHRRLGWLAAVGRTALSNYLLQSILCTLIFYGHGFGLFGRVERAGQIAIVAGVWLVQIVLSNLWLRWFQFGPVEWFWRSATYGRRQPMRRPVSADM